jgi:hypothetical protein
MGTQLGFINVGTERRIVEIAAADSMVNDNFACALLDNGSITCWGAFFAGQVLLGQGETAVAISAGEAHICALLHDGDITCWGKNTFGQLGLGDTTWRNNPDEPVDLGLARTAISVEASGRSTCAILDNQTLKCWGSNESGQLGLGDNLNRGDGPNEMGDSLTPIDLGPSRYATSISGSLFHTCASLDDGTVKCWGSNYQGLLGRGDTTI